MRRTRYSPIERGVRAVLEGHSFGWFVGGYVAVALAVLLAGTLLNLYTPWLLPDAKGWSGIDGFLKDATSYLIAAQVGLLTVVSVAVGLVTLIAQRDERAMHQHRHSALL
jgi:multisubunit Na+/H+ antiporter MnhB subunit